ncbi:hypothetical protein AB3S75_042213 [Citrus x aurantiifolia]
MYPCLIEETNGSNSKDSAIQLFTSGKTQDYAASCPSDKSWEAYDDLANEIMYFPNSNDDDVELDKSWVGYEDDLFQIEIDRKKGIGGTNGFLFDPASNNRMIMRMGQRFKNDFEFRTALEGGTKWIAAKFLHIWKQSECR